MRFAFRSLMSYLYSIMLVTAIFVLSGFISLWTIGMALMDYGKYESNMLILIGIFLSRIFKNKLN